MVFKILFQRLIKLLSETFLQFKCNSLFFISWYVYQKSINSTEYIPIVIP